MARVLVGQNTEDCQVLRTDNRRRFIVNSSRFWQFLFGPNTSLSSSIQVVKLGVELDPDDLDKLRFTGYLYNPADGVIDNAASCTFKIYKVSKSGWQDVLIDTLVGTQQLNHYFFAEKAVSGFLPTDFDGGPTMMVEVGIVRLGENFRERIYINHLGIYDSFIRLKQYAEFLDLTKVDE